jgi:hypothetical protein
MESPKEVNTEGSLCTRRKDCKFVEGKVVVQERTDSKYQQKSEAGYRQTKERVVKGGGSEVRGRMREALVGNIEKE